MHLKQLKLVGFKSFIDPITIPFPSQLVAVVGPNGCGKSNIIDAVKWVLGESSAKNLRGESLTDVIFNGSTTRKALGQASVELIFDNSLGRLSGQHGHYQEVAIKRVVTRDGDSAYFLNKTRCRRRDITDLFLGTGTGARSYSIIGQGTISKLVEAQPEALRAYLEEAAGISKYKERRRETVLRITHTRENLTRLSDIRAELATQILRLERQAKAAHRYQELKRLEHLYKAEILTLKWQHLTQEEVQLKQELTQLLSDYEQYQTAMTAMGKLSVSTRLTMEQLQDELQAQQAQFYQLTTEIARLEDCVQRRQQESRQLAAAKKRIALEKQALSEQLKRDKAALEQYEQQTVTIHQQLITLQQQFAAQQQAYHKAQQERLSCQVNFEQAQEARHQHERQLQIQQLHHQHIIKKQQDLHLRLEKNHAALATITVEMTAINLDKQQDYLDTLVSKRQMQEKEQQSLTLNFNQARQQVTQAETQLHKAQDDYHQLNTAQAAMAASIKALSGENDQLTTFQSNRLLEILQVDKKWQYACEVILNNYLHAIVVENIELVLTDIDLQQLSLTQSQCFTTSQPFTVNVHTYPSLAAKISGTVPYFLPNLHKIFTAQTINEARLWLPNIKEDESIITPEGCWIAKGWVRIAGQVNADSDSLLHQQEALNDLTNALHQAKVKLTLLQLQRDELHINLKEYEQKNVQAKDMLFTTCEEIRALTATINTRQLTLEQLSQREMALVTDSNHLKEELIDLAEQGFIIEQAMVDNELTKQQLQQEYTSLSKTKEQFEVLFTKNQAVLDEIRTSLHQTELAKERHYLGQQQALLTFSHNEQKLQDLSQRLDQLSAQLLATVELPNDSLEKDLSAKLSTQRKLQENLTGSQARINALKDELANQAAQIKADEKQIQILQEKIQQLQLQLQTFRVQISNLLETLQEQGFQVAITLANLEPQLTIREREQHLAAVIDQIKHLGAINLAAIEEYEVEAQRKKYLDEQYEDLIQTLGLLDDAIKKLDKDTKARFQEAFDEINATFQSLFPKLFGGGQASLILTDANLLDAGVLVMAQPPGKRNNTIHLLSGGEKAMTAVALIFAIFQLNPSPFCMLDEVDAPLDEVNVTRFCALVKEMSQAVQFLFITHNKVTMELAEHLIGVTMSEPGVSRIVTVDVKQTLASTEA